jgi:hypothetical protein
MTPLAVRFRQQRNKAKIDWVARLVAELEVGLSGGERKQDPWGVARRFRRAADPDRELLTRN